MGRVLIVEPHAETSALLELVVRRLGHEAVVYRGLDPLRVDVAVIEPGDGLTIDLARRLQRRGVPLLFTSIFPADRAALDLEPAAYLVKPFPLFVLEAALSDALAPEQPPAAV